MGSAFFDDITRALFAQLRGTHEDRDYDVLICPKCRDRLEPQLLEVYNEGDEAFQRVWWTCRGLREKRCYYPLNVPMEVFWTKRTMEQMKEGLIPLPNIDLLPKEWHYLYPNLFGPGKKSEVGPSVCHASEYHRSDSSSSPSKRRQGDKGSTGSVSAMSEDVDTHQSQQSTLPSTSAQPHTSSEQIPSNTVRADDTTQNSNTTEDNSDSAGGDDLLERVINEVVAMPVTIPPTVKRPKVIPSVLYQVDESHRRKWAESLLQLHSKSSDGQRTSTSRAKISLIETQNEKEPDMRPLEIVRDDEGRRVHLFPSPAGALQSALSLRFANDRFIKAVKSEIDKDVESEPTMTAANQHRPSTSTRDVSGELHTSKSAPMLAQLADRAAPVSSGMQRHEDVREQSALGKTHGDKPLLTESSKLAASLSARLGLPAKVATEHVRTAQKRPPNQSLGVTESIYSQGAAETAKSFATVSDFSRTNTSSSTPSSSENSRQKKRRQRYPKGHPLHIESLGDPDLDNLVQSKLRELLKENKSLKRRRKQASITRAQALHEPVPQITEQPRYVDEFGFPIASASQFQSVQPHAMEPATSAEHLPVPQATLSYTPDAFSEDYSEEADLAFGLDSY